MQIFKKLLTVGFSFLALNCFAALLNPIVLVHGIQPFLSHLGPDGYGTWQAYRDHLVANQGLVSGGVWRASSKGGRTPGADCVAQCPAFGAASADVFIVSFTSGADLTFGEQGGELAAIFGEINFRRAQSVKFSIVAHSMGGLAARFYVQNLHTGRLPYADNISQLITVGTPHKGSGLAKVCDAQNTAAYSAVLSGLQGRAVPALAKLAYAAYCNGNESIHELAPNSDPLNVLHRCTATGAIDCGVPTDLATLGLELNVKNSSHTLPANVSYKEVVVRMTHKTCVSSTFYELDTANANSTAGYALCNAYATIYAADGDDIGSDFSQRFFPPVANGALPALPLGVVLPSVELIGPIDLDDAANLSYQVGHLLEAGSTVVQSAISDKLNFTVSKAVVKTKRPTTTLPNSLLLHASFACKGSVGGCYAGSTATVLFRYGTTASQLSSTAKSMRATDETFVALDKTTDLSTVTLTPTQGAVSPNSATGRKASVSVTTIGEQAFSLGATNLPAGGTIYYKACVSIAGVESCGDVESQTLPLNGTAAALTLPAPAGLAPASGSASPSLGSNFTWNAVANASSYRVALSDQSAAVSTLQATDGDCASCLVNVVVSSTGLNLQATNVIAGKTYYWRVKARNPEQYGNWSPTYSFTINASTALPAPVLQMPPNGQTVATVTPNFAWSPVATATSYRLLISENSADLSLTPEQSLCAGCVSNFIVSETTYTLPANVLIAGQTYYWRVKARSPTQYGQLSEIRSFTVVPQSCSHLLSPSPTLAVVSTAGTASVAVSTQSGCAINITSSPPWLAASVPSVADISGYATIGLNVQANPNAASRTAALTVNGRTINISQAGTAPATSYTITVVQGANGAATPSGTTSYGANQQVTLTATPANSAYLFSGWKESGSFVSFNSTWTFNATQNRTITAEFIASRISQNVQMNGADEYARWRVYPGPDAWSKSSDYVSLAPNQSYDLVCSDTPYFYANPGKVTWGLGTSYNGPFSCNYLPKSGGGALNLPIASQGRVAVDSFNYLAKLADGRVAVWGAACQAAPGNGFIFPYCDGVTNMLLPQVVPGLTGTSAVSAFNPNNGKLLAKLSAGGWSTWKGFSNPKLSPSAELGMQDVALVRGTLAVKNDGTLWTISQDAVLAPVGGIINVVDAAQASQVIFALKKDGAVVAISADSAFAFTIGIDFDDYTNFVVQPRTPLAPLPSINRVVSMAATGDNMYAVKQDGTVWVWGTSGAGYGGVVRPVGGYPTSYRPLPFASKT